MSSQSKAKKRVLGLGEPYSVALAHGAGSCLRCKRGHPCEGCKVDPCWTCLPFCTEREGFHCYFDDICVDGKRCVHCGLLLPRARTFVNDTEAWIKAASNFGFCPVFPCDTRIRVSGPPISMHTATRTGRDPFELHHLLQEVGKVVLPKTGFKLSEESLSELAKVIARRPRS